MARPNHAHMHSDQGYCSVHMYMVWPFYCFVDGLSEKCINVHKNSQIN